MNMPDQKVIIGVAVMGTWLGLVLAGMSPPDAYVEMLKGIMGAAVLIHFIPPKDKP